MTLAVGEQVKTLVDEMIGKNLDLEEEVKTLTLKLENSEGQVEDMQSKIHDLEEEVKVLKSVTTRTSGGEKDVSDFYDTRVKLEEENKSLRLERLELTVEYQMGKMWEMINLELKGNSLPKMPRKQLKDRQIKSVSDPKGENLISSVIRKQEVPVETDPFKIERILDKIFDSLPLSTLFKCRSVCKHWNNILVPKINRNGNNTRLLRIVDPLGGGYIPSEDEGDPMVKAIDIKEILATITAGRLEYSTCTKIYFNESMEFNPSVFEEFLALHGKNIKVLHYDGYKIQPLRKVLKMCTQKLECLSLWRLSDQSWTSKSQASTNGLYENDEEPKLFFPELQNITFVSGEDGNRYMRRGYKMKHITFHPVEGLCSPSEDFLTDIFQASPKLHSLSCRLFYSKILEALTKTNSLSKLNSLCLKSRVGIPQLRSLISAQMRLKILILKGFCVKLFTFSYDHLYDETGRNLEIDPNEEFPSLLVEFLKSQATTLEYLKLDVYGRWTERCGCAPDIPTDVLLDQFPHMPNLITLVVGEYDVSGIGCPFEISTFGKLFPKLRNLQNTPCPCLHDYENYDDYIDDLEADVGGGEDFQVNYPVVPNAAFSLRNIRGVEISPTMALFFPFITELHLVEHIRILHNIPSCLPRLKHFYYVVDIQEKYEEIRVLKLIGILNGFMTGISPEEYGRIEEEHEVRDGYFNSKEWMERLNQVQFARTRPSIFDLSDLETLDFKFSCYEFESACESRRGILSAMEVLISWGLSRMQHLKKLRFQFEQKGQGVGNALPDSCGTLLKRFENRKNLKSYFQEYDYPGSFIVEIWNFELNLKHHTSEWDQMKFFREDPDIWDLGLNE